MLRIYIYYLDIHFVYISYWTLYTDLFAFIRGRSFHSVRFALTKKKKKKDSRTTDNGPTLYWTFYIHAAHIYLLVRYTLRIYLFQHILVWSYGY